MSHVSNSRRLARWARGRARHASTLALGLLLAGCARPWQYEEGFPLTTTDASTDFNEAILQVYGTITYITIVVFVIVSALLAYVLYRFRDDGSPGNPEQIHGNIQLEIGWTLIPVVIVIALLVPTVRTIFQIADAAPEGALEIRVIGKRWWWEFQYVESGVITANEMHLPVDRPVSLLLESDTVIHSFWVPRLGGKRDLVPGRTNRIWFTIDSSKDGVAAGQPHRYLGECAEYCGESHALMRFDVIAHTPDEFEGWLTAMQTPPALSDDALVRRGEQAFSEGGCVGCHTIVGNDAAKGTQGPSLTNYGDRVRLASGTIPNTPENLLAWIRDPDAIKPGTTKWSNPSRGLDGMNIPVELTVEQVNALVAYLMSLKSGT